MRLLLIEDNERFAALLKRGLTSAGFVVDVLPTAEEAKKALRENRFEIVVLDLGLPDADGLDVLNEMRRDKDATPVLILTARGSLKDRVNGLGSGADDYLVKPFALEELVARLRALLRRPGNLLGVSLELGNVTLDTVARQVLVGDEPIFFSPREIAVLEHLLRRSGRVVGKSVLENNLYGLTQEIGSNAVEVYVHRLRKRFAEVGASVQIHTLRGVGYLIAEKR
jgi:DNA-binding response OmpR family regulator